MLAGKRTTKADEEKWLCTVVGFAVAMVAAGIVGFIMAKTWLPIWMRAVLFIGTFVAVIYASRKACDERAEKMEREADLAAAAAATARTAEVADVKPSFDTNDAVGSRPAALSGPRDGTADDLTVIKGVGPTLEKLCHKLGYYHFDQIAAWTDEEVAWVDENLEGFKGRVSRDEWVKQAKELAAG